MLRDLHAFIAALRGRKEILEITAPVDPRLELAEIHRRVIEEQGPALLFRNVKGSSVPVVTNLFGTKSRVELAFGNEGKKLVAEVAKLPEELMPPSFAKLWAHRKLFTRLAKVGLKKVPMAKVAWELEQPARLEQLPIITSWPEDGGPFITLPLVYTEHPDTKMHNLGMYRMQRFSDTMTGMHMQIGKGGGFHLARARERKEKLPLNVFIGGPPAAIMAAIAPLPENVPELILASLLLGERLRLAKNPAGPLPLLADAEFVLVGSVDPEERKPEGPFGDHYGYYSLTHDFPVFRCDAVLKRKDAIYPATVVGKPRQEDFFIGDYLQELLSPLFPLVMPAVRDLWSYGETGYHSLAAAVVRERYKREALASALRILGEGQLSLTKFLLLLDKPMDLTRFTPVLEYILARADFRSDLYVFSHTSMDTLDYTGPKLNEGSKGVLLGIGDPIRELPRAFESEPPPGVTGAVPFCGGCLVVSGPAFADDKEFAARLTRSPQIAEWPLIVLVDDAREVAKSEASFLWHTFTKFEPAADIHAKDSKVNRFHIELTGPLVIDARMKPWYPGEVLCDQDTKKLVDSRWREYFPK